MRAGFGVSMQGQGGGGTADPKEWLWALAVAQPHTALGKSKAGFGNCGDAQAGWLVPGFLRKLS